MTPGEIYQIRKQQLGMSQVQFSQLFGVHPLTVSRWERGLLAPTPHQTALLQSFAKAQDAQADIGKQVTDLLVTAGIAVALYALLRAALGEE